MQLDEFVKTSIVQIAKGVKDAQGEVEKLGGAVNPTVNPSMGFRKPDRTSIEFDVALVVQDTNASEFGGKISVASVFGMAGKQTEKDSYQQTSRIQFNVFVDLPCTGQIDY